MMDSDLSDSVNDEDSAADDNDPLEECLFGKQVFMVPESFCTQEDIFKEVLSVDTWNNILTDEHRARLCEFLPKFPENDHAEKLKTIENLFSGRNFNFGDPISRAFNLLNEGFLSPEVAPLYASNQMAIYREYKNQQNDYHYRLLRQVLISRKKLLDSANMLPPDEPVKMQQFAAKPKNAILCERTRLRYFSVLQEVREEAGDLDTSSEDENYPECSPPKVSRKHKKQLQIIEASLSPEINRVTSTVALPPGHQGSGHFLNRCLDMIEVSDERYREMLLLHRRRKTNEPNHPELNVSKVNLNTMISRANLPKRPLMKIETQAKKKSKHHEASEKVTKGSNLTHEKIVPDIKPQISNLKLINQSPSVSNGELPADLQLPQLLENLFQPDVKSVKIEVKDEILANDRLSPDVEVPQFPTCFFSLIRDLFNESPELKLSASKLEEKVRQWQDGPMSIFMQDWLHSQESWPDLVSSALKFLAGDLISILPESFVPFLDYKEKQQQWQWIGTGRDSEEQMSALCQHWLGNKDNVSLDILETCQKSPPPPRVTTIWTVRATTDEEKSLYWEQERVRYQNPHKAFTFKVHGYESVVGPVKGVYGKESGVNKAREHSLLISDRPPFVTILSLVRDAAARLPNGQGTRADICELLKDSQYLSLASDQQIHTVVSGALDRLHYEKDPCVKYDVNRKLWIYLHRNRTEGEFERIHQAQAAAAKARRAVQKNKPPKSKCKEAPRPAPVVTGNTTEERVAALLNVDVTASVSPTTTAHSPRGASPRAQGSPKQSHPVVNRQLLRQLSAASQSQAKVSMPMLLENTQIQRKSELTQASLTAASLGHTVVLNSSTVGSSQQTLTSGILPHFHTEGNNSRPPSQGSVQSLPSPKTVIANVNAAQFVGVGSLQVGPSSSEPSASSAVPSCLGVLSVDMKPSSPSFVGQPPVLQPVISHQTMVSTPSLTCVSTAIAPTYVPSIAVTTSKPGKLISAPSTSKALPSFQTIVIKPDTSVRPASTLSSLPILSVDDLSTGDGTISNNPVVARLLHGSQLLSLGNIVSGNVPGAMLKQSNSTVQNFKLQGTDFVQQVLPTSTVNLFPTTASSEIKIPRLALVSQEGTVTDTNLISSSSLVGQSSLYQHGTLPLADTKVSSAHKELPEVKRVTISSQTQRPTTSTDISQYIDCVSLPNHVMNKSTISSSPSAASCSTHTLQSPHGKSPHLVGLATQENLKPLASTYVMSTPITNASSIITTQHGLRTANALNVRALQGIKVIPVAQSIGSNKNFRSTPLLARIISPSAGLALRSGVSGELVHTTHQLKGGTTMNILHSLQPVNASPHLIKAGPHAGSSQDLPSSQPFIIQVQAPKSTDEDLNL